jgi:ABC-type nitrate/sulfonate/bicarbonate transport system substrate-binding protein
MKRVVLLILLISGAVSFTSLGWTQEKVVLAISEAKTFELIPAYIGNDLGLWKKRGLNVEVTALRGTTEVTQAMVAGKVDIGCVGSTGAILAITKDVAHKVIYAISNTPGFMVVIVGKDSGINSVKDLKGKNIGVVRFGTFTDWMVQRLSKEMGWDPQKGINRVSFSGFREHLAAMQTRQTDGFIWTADGGYDIEEKGLGKILVSIGKYVPNFIFQLIWAPTALIEKEPDKVRRVLEGWAEATAYMKNNKEKTVEFMVKYLEVSPTTARKVYDLDMKNMDPAGVINRKSLKAAADSLLDLGIVKEGPTLEKLYTDKFLPVKF